MQEIKVKPGYKMTELGVIPEDWDIKTLKDISFIQRGASPRPIDSPIWFDSKSNVGWVRIADVTNSNGIKLNKTRDYFSQEGINSSRFLPKGSLIMSICATIGLPVITNIDTCIHDGFVGFSKLKNVDQEYFYYYLKKSEDIFKGLGQTGSQANLNTDLVNEYKIPLPSVSEQKAIAKSLYNIDELLNGFEKLIKKKENIKEGTMQELLTGKSKLPGFDIEFENIKLGYLVDVLKGSGLSKEKLSNNGINECILYGELFTTYDRKIDKVYNKTNYNEGTLSKIDDILIPGSTTTTGIDLATASSITKSGVLLGGDINILRRKNKNYNSLFLSYYLSNINRHKVAELAQGITIIHLYGKDLLHLELKIPLNYEYQSAVVNVLSDMDNEIGNLKTKRDKYKEIKEGMMQELLTGKTRLV